MASAHYQCGNEIRTGDRVTLAGHPGVVVAVIDTRSYSPPDFPEQDWAYLKTGFVLKVEGFGLVYEKQADEDLELVARLASS